MRLSPLLILLPLVSCAPAPVTPGAVALVPSPASQPDATPDPGLPPAEREEISALIAETLRVLRLPAFDRNLRSLEAEFGRIAQSPFGKRLPAATIADLMLGRDSRYGFHPARVSWKNRGGASVADEGIIRLSNDVRDNWRAADDRRRSLAVNSLAHELSHSVSACPDRLCLVFADSGFSFGWLRGNPPVASYTIGSAAQCTWLEERGRMSEGLFACMRRYGLRNFTP